MMKYVVCGTSVEDVEAGVQAMKMAIASGATCGVGGSSMAEVEQALGEMRKMGGNIAPSQMGGECLRSPNGHCPYCECEAIAGGDAVLYEDDYPDYEEGYMAYRNGDHISYDLYDTAEDAMAYALSEGWGLDEIEISYVRAYDDGEAEVLEDVYPN